MINTTAIASTKMSICARSDNAYGNRNSFEIVVSGAGQAICGVGAGGPHGFAWDVSIMSRQSLVVDIAFIHGTEAMNGLLKVSCGESILNMRSSYPSPFIAYFIRVYTDHCFQQGSGLFKPDGSCWRNLLGQTESEFAPRAARQPQRCQLAVSDLASGDLAFGDLAFGDLAVSDLASGDNRGAQAVSLSGCSTKRGCW